MMKQLDELDHTGTTAVEEQPATLDDVARLLRGIRAELRAGHAELLRAGHAAALLGVGRSTLYRMGHAEKLLQPVHTKGGKRWRRSDLLAYIAMLKK